MKTLPALGRRHTCVPCVLCGEYPFLFYQASKPYTTKSCVDSNLG